MPGRRERAPEGGGAADRPAASIAIYHVTKNFGSHVAPLRRSGRFRVTCWPQDAVSRTSLDGFDGVLWELVPGQAPNRRRLASLARRAPLVSYSAHGGGGVLDLSRSLGFKSHLKTPLRAALVARSLRPAPARAPDERPGRRKRPLDRQLKRSDVLADMVRATMVPVEPARVADALVSRMATWLAFQFWAVVTVDHEQRLVLLGERLATDELEQVVQAIGRWVLNEGLPFASASVTRDRRVPGQAGAALAFPLSARGRTVGAVVAVDREPLARKPVLTQAVQASLGTLLEPAALALDNALRMQRAEALSVTDDLTQLYNSRFLTLVLRRETKRASRSGRPLSLLFIDLDGFKTVNDVHGHLCGSRALVEVAAVIKASARETDMVARFGGDEFALVLPDTGQDGAVAVGERIRDRIFEHRFLAGEGLHVHVTASVGVATLPDVAASAEGLLRAADRAMYWVKEHGKNGISVFTT